MKVLLVNGSPHQEGCTYTALCTVSEALNHDGIDTDVFWIGNKPISGCIACHKCSSLDRCVFKDTVNEFLSLAGDYDGFIFGTPVHWAGATGAITSFLDRAFYADLNGEGNRFYLKPAAAVISARRAGTTATWDQVNKYFGLMQMPNSLANRSIWSRLLKCGECGQPYHKYTEKGKPIKWKCKHYIYHNRVCCRNDFLSQEELEEAFILAINQVIEEPDYLKDDFLKTVLPQSTEECRLDNRIHEKLSETACDAQSVKLLAYRRAAAAYQRAEEDGRAYYNEKMKRVLEELPRQTACDLTLLEQTIERIVVQRKIGLNFCFKNGRSILISMKEGS